MYGFASVDCVIGTAQGYEEEKTDPLYVVRDGRHTSPVGNQVKRSFPNWDYQTLAQIHIYGSAVA